MILSVGQNPGTISEAWSLDYVGLSVTRIGNRAGTGSAFVTVHGTGLGLVSTTVRAREGRTECESSMWESETSVACRVEQGVRGTRRVTMTAGMRGGSVTQGFSVDTIHLSVVRRSNRAGTGSGSVTVHGLGMGVMRYSSRGRQGHTQCEATDWESETSVRCRLGHGAGLSRRLMITVGERSGSLSQMWSTDVTGLSIVRRSNRAGTGASLVTLHGTSLGSAHYTAKARGGHTGCEGTDWESETSVRCRAGHGLGGTRRLAMTVGGRGGQWVSGMVC